MAGALQSSLIRPASELFNVFPLDDLENDNKLGNLYLRSHNLLNSDLGVAPFLSTVTATGQSLSLWCMIDNYADIPFYNEYRSRADYPIAPMKDFILSCYKQACHNFSVHLLSSEIFLTDYKNILDVYNRKKNCEELFPHLKNENIYINSNDFNKINFEADFSVRIVRIFMAAFFNCLQHGHPLSDVMVVLNEVQDESSGRQDIKILIQNQSFIEKEFLNTVQKYFRNRISLQ